MSYTCETSCQRLVNAQIGMSDSATSFTSDVFGFFIPVLTRGSGMANEENDVVRLNSALATVIFA